MFDFPTGDVLAATAHRPWPLPDGPWIMTQSWHDLLFAHWPVHVGTLRTIVPSGLELDLFDGQAYLAVVPFHMTNVAPRGVPSIPFMSAFNELNVRTYVTMGGKPGVYFFSLDADSAVAVTGARAMFHLPYFTAAMNVEVKGDQVRYESRRSASGRAELSCNYSPAGPTFTASPGSLEWFLTERYCLYTVDGSNHACRLEIQHPPWPLRAAEARFTVNTMADAAGIQLPSIAPLLHFAKRQDVVAWPLRRI